jgi:hypothetical protein
MTFHPEWYIGAAFIAFIALVALTIAPPVLDQWAVSHLPPAVRAATEDRLPGSQTIRVETRAEGGQTVYDLHMRQGHERYVVRVTPDGRVLRSSHAVGILDLPDALQARLRERCPAASRIRDVTAVTAGNGEEWYEVRVVAEGTPSTIVLDAGEAAGGATVADDMLDRHRSQVSDGPATG